jgi:hypothetical protein
VLALCVLLRFCCVLVEAEFAGSLEKVRVGSKVKGLWWRTTVNENCLGFGFPVPESRYKEFGPVYIHLECKIMCP